MTEDLTMYPVFGIGETVFLSRTQAEAALEAMKDG